MIWGRIHIGIHTTQPEHESCIFCISLTATNRQPTTDKIQKCVTSCNKIVAGNALALAPALRPSFRSAFLLCGDDDTRRNGEWICNCIVAMMPRNEISITMVESRNSGVASDDAIIYRGSWKWQWQFQSMIYRSIPTSRSRHEGRLIWRWNSWFDVIVLFARGTGDLSLATTYGRQSMMITGRRGNILLFGGNNIFCYYDFDTICNIKWCFQMRWSSRTRREKGDVCWRCHRLSRCFSSINKRSLIEVLFGPIRYFIYRIVRQYTMMAFIF